VDRDKWTKRGLILWNHEAELITRLTARQALQALDYPRTNDDWEQDGVVVGEPAIWLALDDRDEESKQILTSQFDLDGTQAREILGLLESKESGLQQMAEAEEQEEARKLSQVYSYLISLDHVAEADQESDDVLPSGDVQVVEATPELIPPRNDGEEPVESVDTEVETTVRPVEHEPADSAPVLTELEEKRESTLTATTYDGFVERTLGASPKTKFTSEEAMKDAVRRNAQAFFEAMEELSKLPDEAELAFGLKATDDGEVTVVETNAEATYSVTFTWKRKEDDC
jgi:hypothetical protein